MKPRPPPPPQGVVNPGPEAAVGEERGSFYREGAILWKPWWDPSLRDTQEGGSVPREEEKGMTRQRRIQSTPWTKPQNGTTTALAKAKLGVRSWVPGQL